MGPFKRFENKPWSEYILDLSAVKPTTEAAIMRWVFLVTFRGNMSFQYDWKGYKQLKKSQVLPNNQWKKAEFLKKPTLMNIHHFGKVVKCI